MKGGLYETRPGVWRLRVFVGNDPVTGEKRRVSRTFVGPKRAAETALSKFVAEMADGTPGSPTMTVSGLLAAFCAHSETVGRSPTTLAEYRRLSRNLAAGIGKVKLSKLTPHHLDELYSTLGRRGVTGGDGALSPASVNRYHDLLKAACRQAVKWGWLDANPVDRASPPSEPRAKVTAPSPAELRLLIAKAAESREPSNALLIALAALTGARRGELAALRWSDIGVEPGVVIFRRAVKQVGGSWTIGDTKTHSERSVQLPKSAAVAVGAHMAQVATFAAEVEVPLHRDPFLFSPSTAHDRPLLPSSISHAFSRTAKACGLPYHLHQLRHFAATQAIAAGFDPVSVAARLGHADPSVTMRVYSHALDSVDKAIGDHLGELVEGPK